MSLSIELQYFPPVVVFKTLVKEEHVIIEQYEHFKKMSFRNRCIISGANGLVALTVPIEGGREHKALIRDVKVDNSQFWQRNHLRTLTSAYNKAPFFEYYIGEIKVLLNSNEKFLFDLNLNVLTFLIKSLNINPLIKLTSEYRLEYCDVIDLRNKILPKNFQDCKELWKPKYFQVFEDRWGFQPNLSILDLLFCEGPNAVNLLASSI